MFFYLAVALAQGAFVVSDVDGTITKWNLLRWVQDGVVELLQSVGEAGLFPIYLSNRPAFMTDYTRSYLQGIGLPVAPVITNPATAVQTLMA